VLKAGLVFRHWLRESVQRGHQQLEAIKIETSCIAERRPAIGGNTATSAATWKAEPVAAVY